MAAVPFDEYQRSRNEEFYKGRGIAFKKEFKTFASDVRFARALAADFSRRMKAAAKEERGVRVYEFGVGDGSLGTRFLLELRKLNEALAEKTIYCFCDFSEEMVKNAVKRADAFGFNAEGIVHDAAKEEPKFLAGPDCILMNEFYDDLPAKMLLRKGEDVMEIAMEGKKQELLPFRGEERLKKYVMGMPEGYMVPLNSVAKKHLDFCAGRLGASGWMDIFDYGFGSAVEMREMPAEMWNNSIIREFGGQVTTDVNFDFLSQGLEAGVETQLEFVERALGEKLYEVEMDRLRYLDEKEIKCSRRELKKYGYPAGLGKEARESRGYLHMRVTGRR